MSSLENVPNNIVISYTSILIGIAISLKRIADKLELAQKQPIIMTAEEALKFYKDRDGT
jgi:hypothetical protein